MSSFAILMESNENEVESWYYFLKVQGNEKALAYLKQQLDKMDMVFEDNLNTFVLETDNPVSEQTAREMCKIDVNHTTFHRKFDGKLEMIYLNLKKRDSNLKMLKKINHKLINQGIEKFIDEEDEIASDNLACSSTDEESDGEDLLVPPPNSPTIEQEKSLSPKSESPEKSLSPKSESPEK